MSDSTKPFGRVSEEVLHDGCDCTELCSMGPTCPGAILAGLPDSGCYRRVDSAELAGD